jgi:hypothetical protein
MTQFNDRFGAMGCIAATGMPQMRGIIAWGIAATANGSSVPRSGHLTKTIRCRLRARSGRDRRLHGAVCYCAQVSTFEPDERACFA